MNGFIRGRQLGLCAGLLLLAGCAGFSRDGGFAVVEQAAEQQLDKQLSWSKTPEERTLVAERVTELLAQPLSADAAVQIALLNNRGVQASFDQLASARPSGSRPDASPIRGSPSAAWSRAARRARSPS